MILHSFGDSFVMGDQDDFWHEFPAHNKPNHNFTDYSEHVKYLKANVSFPSVIGKELDIQSFNHAERGSGNYPQLDKLWIALTNKKINSDDLVLFGITTGCRDRPFLFDVPRVLGTIPCGECMVDRDLINSNNHGLIYQMDHFYIHSILAQLSKTFNVKIIKINLFDNPLDEFDDNIANLFKFDNFIGAGVRGNTLIDILNDTWGQGIRHPYHDRLVVPLGYEHLYSAKKHPSIAGHQKIAKWLLDNVAELQQLKNR
jgi:hypothetical protein